MVHRLNLIQDKGRYYKQDILKKEMRKILTQNPNGIDSGEYVEKARKAAGVSRGMVFAHIKDFESNGLIRMERNREDRRKVTYFPNTEKVKTEQRFSEGIEFIRNLGPDMRFAEDRAEDKRFICKVAFFTNLKDLSKEAVQQQAEQMAIALNVGMQGMASKYRLKTHYKIAYILTVKKKE
jgi:DNA-binding MarR family transcriptional regulator